MNSVCVVLGTYNRRAHLERALASARRAADGVGCTFAVVDGGSTDGSREWLKAQSDVVLFEQELPLTGAVHAFNLGFAHAVKNGFPYVFHFNDDAEIVTLGAFKHALEILEANARVGEVAFEFDLRGGWQIEAVHLNKAYGNFGLVRTAAGIEVAKAQGDPTGEAWWNPIYRTYGADCEFGCWLWHLGWTVERGVGLRVHDCNVKDAMRVENEDGRPNRPDSRLFWARWPSFTNLETGPTRVTSV